MTRCIQILAILTACFCTALLAGEGGSLKGSIKLDGPVPDLKPIAIDPAKAADCKCKDAPGDLTVDAATKGIQWAIVRVMDVKAPEPSEPFKLPVIDQANCTYNPRAVVVPVGGTFDVLNPEGIMHTVMLTPIEGENDPMNLIVPPGAAKLTAKKKHFAEPGLHQLSCAPHGWMKGLVAIHDPRFAAVTAPDGTFEIKNVPPGKYKIMINHERFEKTAEVEIKEGASTPLDVTYTPKK